MSDTVVRLQDVSFSYTDVPVLAAADLAVDRGDFASIVGPNGGGKTTLLKLILGLLTPDSGTIEVFGQAPGTANLRVGYVPQHMQFDPRFPATVRDVVLLGRLGCAGGLGGLFGWRTPTDREAAAEALAEVDLTSEAERPFNSLSGGQRQRVLIARALAGRPDLLLLDEPTANVDCRVEQRLMDLLGRVNERLTVLLVSHDLGFVSHYVKSVVCVNRNVVVHPTSEITGEMIQEIYGGDLRMVRHDHRCAVEGHQHDQ